LKVKDRLDALADAARVGPAARGLVLAGRAHDLAAQVGDCALEVAPDIALVADDQLAPAQAARQQLQGHLALPLVGPAQLGPARGAIQGAGKVQAHAQKKRLWLRLQP
jgi:hypothetical protein